MTWPNAPFRDLGKWYGGGTPSKSNPAFWDNGDIPWLSPKDMGPAVLSDTKDHITRAAVAGSSVRMVPAGSVAIVVRSGILERTLPTALVPFETTLNQDMKAVVARDDIDPRWIAWGIRARERNLLRATRKAGTTVASIEMPRFFGATLPIPELEEQRRIVEILEDHLSRLDAAEANVESAMRRKLAFGKSVLKHLIWDEELSVTTVAEVLREPMRNGRSDRASDASDAVRTLTLTAVTRRDFSETNTKMTSTTKKAAEGLWLEPGDVFVQRSNTPELVGTTARYDGPREWAIFPDLLIRLRPDETKRDSRYLAAVLRSERAHRSLRDRAKGLAGSMPKIDQGALGATVIPIPSIERQKVALAELDHLEYVQSRIDAAATSALARSAALRRAVLSAAFDERLTGRHTDQEVIEELAAV